MKRFFVLLIVLCLFLSAGCSKSDTLGGDTVSYSVSTVNDLEGVFLEIIKVTDEGVSFAFVNNSASTICAYGQQGLQKFVDGSWTSHFYENANSVPTPSSYFEALPGGRSDANGPEESIYFELYCDESGEMEPGLYRVIKPVFLQTTSEDGTITRSDWHYLAAEFTIE